MKKRRLELVLVCAIAAEAALLVLTLSAAAAQRAGGSAGPERTAAVMMIPQTDGVHIKYMDGGAQGLFQPDAPLTRSGLAQILHGLTEDRPASVPALSDVPQDAWYADAAGTAVGLGLMTADYGLFRPGDPVTRAECAYALSQLLPYDAPLLDVFYDVWPGYWAYQAICRTAGQGLFYGDGTGAFRPEDSLDRCEAVAVFNRLLGRSPDLQALSWQTGLRTFPDVPPTHWAYGEIMEATVTHQCVPDGLGGESWLSAAGEAPAAPVEPAAPTAQAGDAAGLPEGPQRIDGHLYWVSGGQFVRSCGMDGLQFDENGWYTTGDTELDGMLNELVDRLTNDSMTLDEKLRALYNYVRDNFTYLKRPLISKGQTGWEPEYAKYFLTNGRGNCYNFSATYALLCQELGLPAYTVVGQALNSPHGWVEIQLDGATYLFDTQLAWRYLHNWGKTGYDFFKMPVNKTTVQYTR